MDWGDVVREFWWYVRLWELNWRAFWWQYRDFVDFVFNKVVLFSVAYAIGLVGLNLTRETRLGRTIGNNELTFALAYLAAALASWVAVFGSEPWRYGVRTAIFVSAVKVVLAQRDVYGGWGALHRRAWRNLRAMLRRSRR